MEKRYLRLLPILALLIVFCTACFKDEPIDDNIVRYSYIDEIVNPPDTFQIVYVLNTNNNYTALVEFETNNVWQMERLSANGFIRLNVERTDGSTNEPLLLIERTLYQNFVGFEGGVQYNFIANRMPVEEDVKTFLIQFVKQEELDYDSFSPKI